MSTTTVIGRLSALGKKQANPFTPAITGNADASSPTLAQALEAAAAVAVAPLAIVAPELLAGGAAAEGGVAAGAGDAAEGAAAGGAAGGVAVTGDAAGAGDAAEGAAAGGAAGGVASKLAGSAGALKALVGTSALAALLLDPTLLRALGFVVGGTLLLMLALREAGAI